MFIQSIHVWLRYKTLSSLQLRTVNHKRAVALIDAYVNEKRVLSFEETGKRENILVVSSLLLSTCISLSYLHNLGGLYRSMNPP